MNLVKPSIEFMWMTPEPLRVIERAGRTCYKSENRITGHTAQDFVLKLIKNGHHAMIEHASAYYRVICDRGVTHEIVRHRLFSYGQESTRFCSYKGGVTFILPCWFDPNKDMSIDFEGLKYDGSEEHIWGQSMQHAEHTYQTLLKRGWIPQQARSVLPNSLKTEIVITGNLREWRHFFKLRTAKAAHPQMQEVANMLLEDMTIHIPVLFEEYLT